MIILRWLISAVSLLIVAYIVPGFHIDSLWAALMVAFILGLVNAVIRPIILLLTLPLTILSLGFFILVVNALMLLIASSIVKGFVISSFGAALWGAIVLWLVSLAMNTLLKTTQEADS